MMMMPLGTQGLPMMGMPQASMMMPQQQVGIMPSMYGYPGQPAWQPSQQQHAESDDDTSSSEDLEKRLRRKKEQQVEEKGLASNATHILQIPAKRLQQIIEAIAPDLDSTVTHEADRPDLCRVLHCVAGVKPYASASRFFQAKNYKQANEKMLHAMRMHRKIIGDTKFERILSALRDFTPENIHRVAALCGFQDGWLDLKGWKKMSKTAQQALCDVGNSMC